MKYYFYYELMSLIVIIKEDLSILKYIVYKILSLIQIY